MHMGGQESRPFIPFHTGADVYCILMLCFTSEPTSGHYVTMHKSVKNSYKWKWIALLFLITTCVLLAMCISVWIVKDRQIRDNVVPSCFQEQKTGNFRKVLWHTHQGFPLSQLSREEVEKVVEYLNSLPWLNLTRTPVDSLTKNFIQTIELAYPNKAEVIKYLDHHGKIPKREARVIVYCGGHHPPVVRDMVVGPIPNISYAHVINSTARQTTIPYNIRAFVKFEFFDIYKTVAKVAQQIHHILVESYNASFFKPACGDQCLSFSMVPVSSAYLKEGERKSWFWFGYDIEFNTLHPVDLQFLVDMNSTDPNEWTVETVYYKDQLFSSLQDFIDQYRCEPINKTRINFPSKEERLFSTLEFREPLFPSDFKRPPHQYEPDGSRIKINQNIIEYALWKLRFGMSATVGLQLFDVQFDGERIIYELSMQEVVVTYSGYTPAGQVLSYADSAGLFGTRSRGLLPGVDCPSHAHFLDTFLYSENEKGYRTYENAICVFEQNSNTPIRRHRAYGYSGGFYGGMVNSFMIVRTVVTIINYDYIFDTIFLQNGAIEVRLLLTGYLSTAFYNNGELPYGAYIHKNLIGSLHNHLFHFKVDIDAKGTQNKFETLDIKVENNPDRWSHMPHAQTYYERVTKETELDAIYDYNFSTPKYLLISSANETTKEGVPRSIRLLPKTMSHSMLPGDIGFSGSITWASHQLHVTKHKDEEHTSSSIFSMWDAGNPVVNFSTYYADNENITSEDLVAWVTLGTQHLPQTENLPNTLTVGSEISLFIIPYNYFDEDPSMRSRDGVLVRPNDPNDKGGGARVERRNQNEGQCVAFEPLPDDMLTKDSSYLFD